MSPAQTVTPWCVALRSLYRIAGWDRALSHLVTEPFFSGSSSTLHPWSLPEGKSMRPTPLTSAHLMKRIPKASRYTGNACFQVFWFFFLEGGEFFNWKSGFMIDLVLACLWTVAYRWISIYLANVEEVKTWIRDYDSFLWTAYFTFDKLQSGHILIDLDRLMVDRKLRRVMKQGKTAGWWQTYLASCQTASPLSSPKYPGFSV